MVSNGLQWSREKKSKTLYWESNNKNNNKSNAHDICFQKHKWSGLFGVAPFYVSVSL